MGPRLVCLAAGGPVTTDGRAHDQDHHCHHGQDEHGEDGVEGGVHRSAGRHWATGRMRRRTMGFPAYEEPPAPQADRGRVPLGLVRRSDTPARHAWAMSVTLSREPVTCPRSDALLARLRGEGTERPVVDPGLAGGLRDWLEDALAPSVAALPADQSPLRITKDAISQVLCCEAHFLACRGATRRPTPELARGSLVDALFRQWVTTGAIGDPLADGLVALAVAGDPDGVVHFVQALAPPVRRQLAQEVEAHAATISASWPALSPRWMPRTQERLTVPLAGGRLLLSGVVDLALGAPSGGRASVCIVEVKSGRRRVEHRGDLHFYALLETLRSGAAPFRLATYYSAGGELDVEPVGADVVQSALHRVLSASQRLCRLAAGAPGERTPSSRCRLCPVLDDCGAGRRRMAQAGREDARWD